MNHRLAYHLGMKFGRLTIVESLPSERGTTRAMCVCACGTRKSVAVASLYSGNTRSCGCYRQQFRRKYFERGTVFGRLTVSARAESFGAYTASRCRCVCGNEVVVRNTSLHDGNTRSCGCLVADTTRKLKAKPPGVAAVNRAITSMRGNAQVRKIEWKLPRATVVQLIKKNCHYCGIPPTSVANSANFRLLYNGLDRVDNAKGYTVDNVVPCCRTCNSAKRTMSREDFLSWISRVYAHSLAD